MPYQPYRGGTYSSPWDIPLGPYQNPALVPGPAGLPGPMIPPPQPQIPQSRLQPIPAGPTVDIQPAPQPMPQPVAQPVAAPVQAPMPTPVPPPVATRSPLRPSWQDYGDMDNRGFAPPPQWGRAGSIGGLIRNPYNRFTR